MTIIIMLNLKMIPQRANRRWRPNLNCQRRPPHNPLRKQSQRYPPLHHLLPILNRQVDLATYSPKRLQHAQLFRLSLWFRYILPALPHLDSHKLVVPLSYPKLPSSQVQYPLQHQIQTPTPRQTLPNAYLLRKLPSLKHRRRHHAHRPSHGPILCEQRPLRAT